MRDFFATFQLEKINMTETESGDFFKDTYDGISIKLGFLLTHLWTLLLTVVLVLMVKFESSGLAGHYRTLINQQASIGLSLVSIFLIHSGLKTFIMLYISVNPLHLDTSES